jgi:excisionase family DNA binding protein
MSADRLLTAREVAERFGLTVETVLRWTRRGEMPAFKLGTAVRYRESELEAWLVERMTGAAPREVESQPGARAHPKGYVPLRSLTRANPPPNDDAA